MYTFLIDNFYRMRQYLRMQQQENIVNRERTRIKKESDKTYLLRTPTERNKQIENKKNKNKNMMNKNKKHLTKHLLLFDNASTEHNKQINNENEKKKNKNQMNKTEIRQKHLLFYLNAKQNSQTKYKRIRKLQSRIF